MPKLEPKTIQKELEKGLIWPVYWLYGSEQMKSRELLKRIRKAVLGEEESSASSISQTFNQEVIDAADSSPGAIIDAAQSLSLGGGMRLIIVRDAHALKEAEQLSVLLPKDAKPVSRQDDPTSVCVFLSKDLDGRKKFSKTLIERAAVVPCEEIAEEERDAWIQYLAKRRELELVPELAAQLRYLDPWNLDIIDQELEKYSIALGLGEADARGVLLGGTGPDLGGDSFLEAFFNRKLKHSLEAIETFADYPDEALPLLGLLAWNARFLSLVISDRERGARDVKLGPFLMDRFKRWSRGWSLKEAVALQASLARLDFGIKQTQRSSLGLWTDLVVQFCRP